MRTYIDYDGDEWMEIKPGNWVCVRSTEGSPLVKVKELYGEPGTPGSVHRRFSRSLDKKEVE